MTASKNRSAQATHPAMVGEGLAALTRRALLAVAIASGIAAAPAIAQAQTALIELPGVTRDRGLRSGEFTLHPSITVRGHHDTNVFNGSPDEPGNTPLNATSLRLLPRLALSNNPNSNIAFAFNSTGDARLYLSDEPAIENLTDFGGAAALDVKFGVRKPISFSIFDHFNRSLRANFWETQRTLNRVSNDVGGRIEFHPGEIPERRPFNLAFMGSYAVDYFDDFDIGDTTAVRTRLTGSWKFLPKTAAILDTSWDFRSYQRQTLSQRGLASDSRPFRAKVGLAGALTRRLSLELLGGWGMSLHEQGDSFNNFLASVALGVRPAANTRMLLKYEHDFRDTFYGNFVDFHRGSLHFHQRFGTMLDVKAQFGAAYGVYGTFPTNLNQIPGLSLTQQNRNDVALDGGLTAAFELARLVGMDIGYQLRSVLTDFRIQQTSAAGGRLLEVGEYTAHEIFASVTLRY